MKRLFIIIFSLTAVCFVFTSTLAFFPVGAYAGTDAHGRRQIPPKNDGTSLKDILGRAGDLSPENYAIPFYLGQVHLREGNRDAAIREWERYLAMAPDDYKSASVREQLTLLKIDQATEEARKIVAQDPETIADRRPPENTLAVLTFKNLSAPDFLPFVKALTMMVITDLSKVPRLTLVERIKIQALVDEMRLGASAVVTPASASKMGNLLLAQKIAWGKAGVSPDEKVTVTALVGDTLDPSQPATIGVDGVLQDFMGLEKQLVVEILKTLGLNKADLAPSVRGSLEKIHTTSLKAFMAFGSGLDHLDHRDFAKAKESFRAAAQADPGFDLATEFERSAPLKSLVPADVENLDAFETVEEPSGKQAQWTGSLPKIESAGTAAVDISDIAQDRLETGADTGSIMIRW